jgi:hypothetical protein
LFPAAALRAASRGDGALVFSENVELTVPDAVRECRVWWYDSREPMLTNSL